jgi:hypothetical protein
MDTHNEIFQAFYDDCLESTDNSEYKLTPARLRAAYERWRVLTGTIQIHEFKLNELMTSRVGPPSYKYCSKAWIGCKLKEDKK